MIEIVPTINAESFDDVEKKIRRVESFTNWIQVDVADGTFTPNSLWHNPQDLVNFTTKANLEVHLMLNNIEEKVASWLVPCVKRIIFQVETTNNPEKVIKIIKDAGKEVGLAVGPENSYEKLLPFVGKVDMFQFLAVNPGFAGQNLKEEALEGIKMMRKNCPECIIEIDGGVSEENIKEVVQAGANYIVSASAIFNKENPIEAIKNLKEIIWHT